MKGPSSEDQRHVPYADFNGHAQNLQSCPNHSSNLSYYMHQEQNPTGNYNGNNSGFYPFQEHVGVTSGGYNYMNPVLIEQEPVVDDGNPFAEYAWMADAEEFERQALEQMEQEEFFEACVRQICEEPEEELLLPAQGDNDYHLSGIENMSRLSITDSMPSSALNPNAAEFVPRWVTTHLYF